MSGPPEPRAPGWRVGLDGKLLAPHHRDGFDRERERRGIVAQARRLAEAAERHGVPPLGTEEGERQAAEAVERWLREHPRAPDAPVPAGPPMEPDWAFAAVRTRRGED